MVGRRFFFNENDFAFCEYTTVHTKIYKYYLCITFLLLERHATLMTLSWNYLFYCESPFTASRM